MVGRGPMLRYKVIDVYALLIGANIVAWSTALYVFRGHPVLLGAALLAYAQSRQCRSGRDQGRTGKRRKV